MSDRYNAESGEPEVGIRVRIVAFLVLPVMAVYFLGASGTFGNEVFMMAEFTFLMASVIAAVILATDFALRKQEASRFN